MRKQVYRQRKRRRYSLLLFAGIVLLLLALLIRLDRAIRPTLRAVCAGETKQFAAELMADSVAQVLEQFPLSYEDMAVLLYDNTGAVTAVETRTAQMQQLQSALWKQVQQNLCSYRDVTMKLPLGTATGIWIFAGKGPYVSVRLLPVGSASVKIISELTSAGINQTCHTIRMEVTAQIQAAVPFDTVTVEETYTCLLAETVIVGTVPEMYVVYD